MSIFTADSLVADRVVTSLGHRRGKYQPRTRPPAAVVVHTTGWGPNRRHLVDPQRYGSPLDAALWIYGQAMEAGPHYVLDQEGACVQVAPEDVCAWHVGGKGARPYRHLDGRWAGPEHAWWRQRWAGLGSPRELAGGQLWLPYGAPTGVSVALSSLAGSVNANTIGLEILPPLAGPAAPWSDACWERLVILVEDIAERRGIPAERDRLITHSDAHPLARTARGAPWDTHPTQWSWERYCQVASRDPATGRPAA